jgi:UDP-N-acetylglucosamine--N-acetylmuramyl-(pentapeptide) pyrophosphoryl-undecaprenol N-acetylglucosamine transferase
MATVVFAGGGTAGHIQPALAVAREWKKLHPLDICLFIGTAKGLETTIVPEAGFDLELITRVRVPRSLSLDLLKVPASLRRSISESKNILRGADLLIGFGGYVCAPAYLAARSLKVPIVIHEANAEPGWANRLGARYTDALAVGSPVTHGPFAKALITGLPLRDDITSLLVAHRNADEQTWSEMRGNAKRDLGIRSGHTVVLVFGGSQGSQAINSVIEKTRKLIKEKPITIVHSVGAANELPASDNNYISHSYIENMATAYLASDLVIARSGAITCSEVSALGKYALFIPLPIGNGEQSVNADHLVEMGRARVLEQSSFTASWLLDNMDSMLATSDQFSDLPNFSDLEAAAKIVALAEHQLSVGESHGHLDDDDPQHHAPDSVAGGQRGDLRGSGGAGKPEQGEPPKRHLLAGGAGVPDSGGPAAGAE